MKSLSIYRKKGLNSSGEVFDYLMGNLQETVVDWSYFVDWRKVIKNQKEIEIYLNTLNYLIGKENVEEEFRYLHAKCPDIIKALPILIAYRKKDLIILDSTHTEILLTKKYELKDLIIDHAVEIGNKTGLFSLLSNRKIKNLVDYVFGVEVGLDTNARKNRVGTAMESLVEKHINEIIAGDESIKYISQATQKSVLSQLGYEVEISETNKKIDFAIRRNDKLFFIETNYYSGPGSKLKSTAGEYRDMHKYWNDQGIVFIWITDGLGWKSTVNDLRETFDAIDYTLNLKMLYDGALKEIILKK
ncbi:MAG: type II restriction endonuclease [Candidatus Cloacimonas sp.]|nr:type II restriction endonuclease [Candidatus Cloacimonadota bacterium]